MTEWISDIHALIFDADRLPVAIGALALCAALGMLTGPLGGRAVPLVWIALNTLFGGLGDRLDRAQRERADLVLRGFVITVTALAMAYFLGRTAQELADRYPDWRIAEILCLSLCLAAGTVWHTLAGLYRALKQGKPSPGAYLAIARSARTDLSGADDFTITRTGIALGARAFDKAVVSPLVWYLIAGLPGAYIYAALAGLAWRFGRDGQGAGFGATALALEKLMGMVPHIVSAFLIALAGLFTPTAQMSRALAGWFARKGRAPYEEGGLVVTAAAWSLDVSLGGAAPDLEGIVIKRGWTGPESATARLEPKHLHRALYIAVMAHFLLLAALVGAIVASGLPPLSL